jgi:predicted outer membrane repeat protein
MEAADSTLSGNSATYGGGIYAGAAALTNSIVAGNSGITPDLQISAGSVTAAYSLIGNNNGTSLAAAPTPDASGNLIGTATSPIDPLLDLLANNGGPTQTHALLPGSPAIDRGTAAGQSFDQRGPGFPRSVGLGTDIGAFEVQAIATPVDVDAAADSVAEDAAVGTAVGITISSSDPNGPAVTYNLTDSAGGRFAIDSSTGVVTVADGTLLNFDSATSHMLTVQTSDGAGGTSTANFTISVANVAPTVVSPIADVTANEDQTNTVLNFSGVFADTHTGDSLTLTVSSNSNPGLVTASLIGNTLTLNYQPDQYGTATITIRATDAGGLFVEDTFVVTVLSANEQLGNLTDLINALFINQGHKNFLIKKLESAQNSLAQGNTTPAVNKMNAFINEVEAFRKSGKLTIAEADSLIAGANAIIESML